ncbi:expressed unknown protein [Seminavis robusta]|uniref:Uncharacterized protein n=1 Tax=Seminavis robusta TaxID=568900 RepID=A0A9N8ESQ6_9STRA|nr:expressed unknown protein [Seminavis robusta]|eukprot:Sro1767_g296330.1 n/a (572) ;mRNA; r:20047-21852
MPHIQLRYVVTLDHRKAGALIGKLACKNNFNEHSFQVMALMLKSWAGIPLTRQELHKYSFQIHDKNFTAGEDGWYEEARKLNIVALPQKRTLKNCYVLVVDQVHPNAASSPHVIVGDFSVHKDANKSRVCKYENASCKDDANNPAHNPEDKPMPQPCLSNEKVAAMVNGCEEYKALVRWSACTQVRNALAVNYVLISEHGMNLMRNDYRLDDDGKIKTCRADHEHDIPYFAKIDNWEELIRYKVQQANGNSGFEARQPGNLRAATARGGGVVDLPVDSNGDEEFAAVGGDGGGEAGEAGEATAEVEAIPEAEAEFPPMPPLNHTAAIPPAQAAFLTQEQVEAELAATVIERDELRSKVDGLQSQLDDTKKELEMKEKWFSQQLHTALKTGYEQAQKDLHDSQERLKVELVKIKTENANLKLKLAEIAQKALNQGREEEQPKAQPANIGKENKSMRRQLAQGKPRVPDACVSTVNTAFDGNGTTDKSHRDKKRAPCRERMGTETDNQRAGKKKSKPSNGGVSATPNPVRMAPIKCEPVLSSSQGDLVPGFQPSDGCTGTVMRVVKKETPPAP